MKDKTIAVDFDGTIVEDRYPGIGPLVPQAAEILTRFHAAGGRIILWTCRTGTDLLAAMRFLKQNNIPIDKINSQFEDALAAFQDSYPHVAEVDGRKVAADMYIDDRNPGGVDWGMVDRLLFGDDDGSQLTRGGQP